MKYCSNCGQKLENNGSHCINCGVYIEKDNLKKEFNNINNNQIDILEYKKMVQSIKDANISLVLACIPIILILYCLVVSRGDFSEAGDGAIWWIVGIYYISIGFPIAFISLMFAINSYRNQKSSKALLCIIIDALPFIIILLRLLF